MVICCLFFKQTEWGHGGLNFFSGQSPTPLLVALPSALAILKKSAKFMQLENMLRASEIQAFAPIFRLLEITQI